MEKDELEKLILLFSKLPGLGKRSARRVVLHLIKNKESLMMPLADAVIKASDAIKICSSCGNIDSSNPCKICTDARRDSSIVCVVEDVADLWAIERGKIYSGVYHVLGGTLSALDGRGPDDINIESLVQKSANQNIKEIILATNATMEGQTTAHYITERVKHLDIAISQIAHGIPIGGELDYLDEGTLGAALKARRPF